MQSGAAGTRKAVAGIASLFRAPRRFNASDGLRILYLEAGLENKQKCGISWPLPLPYPFHVIAQTRSLLCNAPNVLNSLLNRRFGCQR